MALVGAAWLGQHSKNRPSPRLRARKLKGCCEFRCVHLPYAAKSLTSQIRGHLKLPYIAVLAGVHGYRSGIAN